MPENTKNLLALLHTESPDNADFINATIAAYGQVSKVAGQLEAHFGATRKAPPHQVYKPFADNFTIFINNIQKLADITDGASQSVDVLTGLRNQSAMLPDLEREQNRFERQGQSFIIALLKVNGFAELAAKNIEQGNSLLIKVAEKITKTLRPYDDAYRLNDNTFLLCLKQTNVQEGTPVIKRLDTQFKGDEYIVQLEKTLQSDEIKLSLSSSIAEPATGTKIPELLESLRQEMKIYVNQEGFILEHNEISPLQKLIQEKNV